MQIKVVFPCAKEPRCFPHSIFFAIKTSRKGPTTYEIGRERRHFEALYSELQFQTRRGVPASYHFIDC